MPPLTAAAEPLVQIPSTCCEGNPFTIKIPVKLQGMSVEYVWYKDGTAVGDTTQATDVTAIAYTVPVESAYGSAVYHFKYRLSDEFNSVWTSSPKYALAFTPHPVQPSAITGSTTACANTTGHTYSVANVSGITYNWELPTGWNITAGGAANSITVTAGTSAISGNISVTPSNSCGTGDARTLAVTVNTVPAQPSTITGGATVCASTTGLTYSVTNATGTTYDWELPSGWTKTAGTTTNSITVAAGTANGSISVTPSNTCGSGTARTLAVSAKSCGDLLPWCEGITSPGTISDAECTGVTAAGIINDGACVGVTSAGTINDGACVGVTSAGTIKY